MNVRPAKETHGWNHRERNGYILLCSLLFIPLSTEFLFRFLHKEKQPAVVSAAVVNTKDSAYDTHSIEKKKSVTPDYSSSKVLVNLNNADSITLIEVKGIGSVLAGRIIKYRNLLGGYVSVEQLKEVYGLKDEMYSKIKSQVFISNSSYKKIMVDSILQNPYGVYHPYWDKTSKKELALAKKNKVSEDSLIEMIYSNKNKHWQLYLNR
jgi:hypothetical protein